MSSVHLPECMLSLWLCLAGFYVASSVPPVFCTCFAAPDGLVGVSSYHSACHLTFSIAFSCRLGGLGFSFGSPVLA